MKQQLNSLAHSDSKRQKTQPFIRNFDHVDGNWPSQVYLIGNYRALNEISDLCLNHLCSRKNYTTNTFIPISSPHLSLSKPFVLRQHQIDSFIRQLNSDLNHIHRFSVQVFSEYQLLCNENKTRLFVTLPVEDRDKQIQKLIKSVDSVLKLFSQPAYYDSPLHHISIASCLNTSDISHSSKVVQVSETFIIKKKYFPNNDNEDSEASDEEESKGCDKKNNRIALETDDVNEILSTEYVGVSEDNSSSGDDSDDINPEVEDCLGTVLVFSGIECRIGNRIFTYKFDNK